MPNSVSLTELVLRPRLPEDDERVVEISNAIHVDRPPQTVHRMRFYNDLEPPEAFFEMHVAEMDGHAVGYAEWSRDVYIEEPDVYWGTIEIESGYRGRGVGRALYGLMLESIGARGAKRVQGYIREDLPQARAFFDSRGFQPTGRVDRASRLDVEAAELDGCRQGFQKATSSGLRLATLRELGADDESVLRAVYAVDEEASRDMPRSTTFTSVPYEKWLEYLNGPGYSPDCFFLAMDGDQPAGLAFLHLMDEGTGVAYNGFTGVGRAYRGRGIARALKLMTVEWARSHGMKFIYTDNDFENRPMLAINIEMGYVPTCAQTEMAKDLPDQGS
jgi:mycothiol synthase